MLNGVTGSIGLRPTLAALGAGSVLALANKESLIIGGSRSSRRPPAPTRSCPVDSEHSAIAQSLRGGRAAGGAPARRDGERRPVPRSLPVPSWPT